MHLGGRDGHSLKRVQNGDAGMRISPGVDDDAVHAPIRLLNGRNKVPLVVRLVKLRFHAQPPRLGRNVFHQAVIGQRAV